MSVNKSALWAVLGMILIMWCAPLESGAQLYRYKDASGNWHYTDNLADVPEDQRENLQEYESVAPPAPKAAKKPPTKKGDGATAPPEKAENLRQELKDRTADLDKEYNSLVDESDKLQRLSVSLNSEEAKKEFERRKDDFNQRVKAFEERRREFELDLKSYNDIVGSN